MNSKTAKKSSKKVTSKSRSPEGAKSLAKKSVKGAVKKSVAATGTARRMIDEKLAEFTPALKQKLSEVQSQIQTGDLRSLGMKVLERAKEISTKIKEAGGLGTPAKATAQAKPRAPKKPVASARSKNATQNKSARKK